MFTVFAECREIALYMYQYVCVFDMCMYANVETQMLRMRRKHYPTRKDSNANCWSRVYEYTYLELLKLYCHSQEFKESPDRHIKKAAQ